MTMCGGGATERAAKMALARDQTPVDLDWTVRASVGFREPLTSASREHGGSLSRELKTDLGWKRIVLLSLWACNEKRVDPEPTSRPAKQDEAGWTGRDCQKQTPRIQIVAVLLFFRASACPLGITWQLFGNQSL